MSSELARFWSKVDKSKENGCWEWTGACSGFGHGNFVISRRNLGAHRVSWEIARGRIPDGVCVLHRCDNPPCVNPAHLFLGTKFDNARDRHSKGRDGDHRGSMNGRSKVKEHDAALILFLATCGAKRSRLAAMFGLSISSVDDICSGRTWKHVQELEAA